MGIKRFYQRHWYIFSLMITLSIGGLLFIFHNFLVIPILVHRILAPILCMLSLSALYIASKITVYKHRFATHPSSFIAQTRVFGEKNTKAFVIFNFWSGFLIISTFLTGKLFADYFSSYGYMNLLIYSYYFASLSVAWMTSIPINISRFGHLGGVLGMFIFYSAGNIIFLIFLQNINRTMYIVPKFYFFISILELSFSVIYMVAYFYDLLKQPPEFLKPGLWQKFWIIAFSLSQMFFILLFTTSEII